MNSSISEDPSSDQDEETRIQQLYRQISKLKDLDKTIIFLYLEQCSYEEIAEITGISNKNVSVRLVQDPGKAQGAKLHIQNHRIMKQDELIHMWQEGSERLFRDEKTTKDMITQYLKRKNTERKQEHLV